ncbi:MAG: hypothetical protein JNM20_02275 [Rhizobiales bacterium]|nr:hypothetical protein [Hyphomicrobiales bacterium]
MNGEPFPAIDDIPHLSGPAAEIRQVLAAHFVRDCPHVVEIGGHLRPVTPYLKHRPLSVLSIDPKTAPLETDTLNGHPCRVRHLNRKFQDHDYGDYEPGTYGLVLLGMSLKPFGKREVQGPLFFSLIDNARIIVLDYPPALERSVAIAPSIVERPGLRTTVSLELTLNDTQISGLPFARRRFIVLEPIRQAPKS